MTATLWNQEIWNSCYRWSKVNIWIYWTDFD